MTIQSATPQAAENAQPRLLSKTSTGYGTDLLSRFIQAKLYATKLRDAISSQVNNGPQEIDMLHWFGRTALELIGQSGLGYSFDNLDEGTPHPYSLAIKTFVPAISRLRGVALMLPYITWLGSPGLRRALVGWIPSADVRNVQKIVDVMDETSHEIVRSKQKDNADVAEKVGGGKDIMSILREQSSNIQILARPNASAYSRVLLVKANVDATAEDRLTDAEVIAQVTTLVFAATDTTSSALVRIFHLMAQHQDVQSRIRDEIRAARDREGDLDYKQLDSLPYLDAVIRETLRLYAPVPIIDRVARKDTILPLSRPIIGLDGTTIHEITVPKGTTVTIAIMRANTDPEIWGDDAHEWKPERWLTSLPDSVSAARFPGVYANLSDDFLGR
ncbi:hypothetical protein HWV62_25452 [Athelia sp. TMB]|nr:hypothetical protein HWV62_25452 [Athelia sp. TMB]